MKAKIAASEKCGLIYNFVLCGSLQYVKRMTSALNKLRDSGDYLVLGGSVGFVLSKKFAKRLIPGTIPLLRKLAKEASRDEGQGGSEQKSARICRELRNLEGRKAVYLSKGYLRARHFDEMGGEDAFVSTMYV